MLLSQGEGKTLVALPQKYNFFGQVGDSKIHFFHQCPF